MPRQDVLGLEPALGEVDDPVRRHADRRHRAGAERVESIVRGRSLRWDGGRDLGFRFVDTGVPRYEAAMSSERSVGLFL
jgi:hypothetical protein